MKIFRKKSSLMKIKFKIFNIVLISIFLQFSSIYAQISKAQQDKFQEVLNNINDYYTDSVSGETIVENAIKSTLKQLDPHSVYLTKKEITELNKGLEGSFEGIGISYYIISDTLFITSTVKGGPSQTAGIMPGDRIIKVDDQLIAGVNITQDRIKELLSGKKGTELELSIKRRGIKKTKNYTIVRDKITVFSINSHYMANDSIGYIKLKQFSASSLDEFEKKIIELKTLGAKHLIFDLRDNGGGYLKTAVDLCDQFLEGQKMIVYTVGKNSPLRNYTTTPKNNPIEGRLIVLVNENSASASEIFSGFIQDWDRGVILGRRTYGKGLVQRPFELNDGSVIRLTTARYYTPSGRSIQKPYSDGVDKYYETLEKRSSSGELVSQDSIKFPDSLMFRTLVNKRIIYGGGGIMPDVFVPSDTLKYPQFYKEWFSGNLLNFFANLYVDENREIINSIYSDLDYFNRNFKIDNAFCFSLLNYIKENAKEEEIIKKISNINTEDISTNKNIKIHLKALIAGCIWGDNGYYKILNTGSEEYNLAVQIISDEKKYNEYIRNK